MRKSSGSQWKDTTGPTSTTARIARPEAYAGSELSCGKSATRSPWIQGFETLVREKGKQHIENLHGSPV
jgi:hypothetical protein